MISQLVGGQMCCDQPLCIQCDNAKMWEPKMLIWKHLSHIYIATVPCYVGQSVILEWVTLKRTDLETPRTLVWKGCQHIWCCVLSTGLAVWWWRNRSTWLILYIVRFKTSVHVMLRCENTTQFWWRLRYCISISNLTVFFWGGVISRVSIFVVTWTTSTAWDKICVRGF